MSATTIEWTDRTWNPTRGCSRVSEGCRHCYAERVAARFSGDGQPFYGIAHRAVSGAGGAGWTGRVELIPSKLAEPLRWRKPARVFVNSMSDLFHESLPDEAIDAVFVAMSMASRHTFQVLTKRPRRMLEYLSQPVEVERFVRALQAVAWAAPGMAVDLPKGNAIGAVGWELPNVWLGVSVEDQATADERIPLLLQTPAATRFVSYEPALAAVDFTPWFPGQCDCEACSKTSIRCTASRAPIDWIIVGGESGPGARPFDVAWARSTIKQCRAAGVACFIKQVGSNPVGRWTEGDRPTVTVERACFDSRKGGDLTEWPFDLRQREFPRVAVPR